MPEPLELTLPATSANLGPAFDAAALALDLHLVVRAQPAQSWSISASGRDAATCASTETNMILDAYRELLREAGVAAPPLRLQLENQIPVGKGFGSSAAARLAAAALASRFGGLGWTAQRVFETAARLEGHADNVAACWWGGLVVAQAGAGASYRWLRVPLASRWRLLLAIPDAALPTEQARAVVPQHFSRADAVANLQSALLQMQAWSQGRADLLAGALADRWHQPYRSPLCPLLPALQPLVGQSGIAGCALSGAGPGVLLVVESQESVASATALVRAALESRHLRAEIIASGAQGQGPGVDWEAR